jgi:hypothetical protein
MVAREEKSHSGWQSRAAGLLVLGIAILPFLPSLPELGLQAASRLLVTGLLGLLLVGDRLRTHTGGRKGAAWTAGFAFALLIGAYSVNRQELRGYVAGRYFQTWNVFHYYLGAKYFDELGYRDLYGRVLLADREQSLGLESVPQVNDLYTYQPTTPEQAIAKLTGTFSPERWQAFRQDLTLVQSHETGPRFSRMLTDHGYNASPFNTVIYRALAHAFTLQSYAARTFLLGLDLVLLVASVGFVVWAYGLRRGLAVGVFFVTFFGVASLQVAGFLRYDWWLATVMAVCLYRRERYVLAGLALSYATMTRIFPAFLLLGPMVQALVLGFRERRVERSSLRLVLAFLLGCGLALPLGATTGRGWTAWNEFYDNISWHSQQHYLGPKRMGLQKLFAFDFSQGQLPDDTEERARCYQRYRYWYGGSVVVLMSLFIAVVTRRSRSDALLLGLAPCFFLVVLSRYYWAVWGLLLLLRCPRGTPGGAALSNARRAAFSDAWVLLLGPAFHVAVAVALNPYDHYQITNWAMLVLLVGVLVEFAREDRRTRLGSGRPERSFSG